MKQFEIYWANLEPTVGAEINKKRPVVIVSPDEMNDNIKTVIVAPITSKARASYPTRVPFTLKNQQSYVVLDQLRTIDKQRLEKCVDTLNVRVQHLIKHVLLQMFS